MSLKSSDSQDARISNKRTWVKPNSRMLETGTGVFRKHQYRWRREQRCREEKRAIVSIGCRERAGRYPMVHADLSTTGKLQPRDGLQSAPPRHADLLKFVASAIQLATVTSGTSPEGTFLFLLHPLLPLPTFFSLFSSGLSCLHLMLIRPQVT